MVVCGKLLPTFAEGPTDKEEETFLEVTVSIIALAVRSGRRRGLVHSDVLEQRTPIPWFL